MANTTKHQILTYLIATVWLINGLLCKIFNLVPRHQQIVARILGSDYAWLLTATIGSLETAMAIWIVSGIMSRTNAIVQIIVIASMNAIEFFVAPDLLLWGKLNALFAFCLLC